MPLSLCIIHVSRTGSHAMQNWLCRQLPGRVQAHIDWCPNFHGEWKPAGRSLCVYNDGKLKRHPPNRAKTPAHDESAHQIVMLENFDMKGWYSEGFDGLFDQVYVICRDPYNWLASAYRQFSRSGNQLKYLTHCQPLASRVDKGFTKWYGATIGGCALWEQHLRHAMGEENLTGQRVEVMDYNRWCVDREYRRHLATALGVETFTDEGFKEVPPHGGGSSWTGRHPLQGDRVTLTRFKEMVDRKQYRQIMTEEMIRIGKDFFGMNCPW